MKYTYEMSREIKAMINGNMDAFQNFYLMTVNDVYFHVRLVIKDAAEADKMLIKIFKSMYLRIDKLDRPENTMQWFNGIIYRHLTDWVNVKCAVMLMDEEDGKYDQVEGTPAYVYSEMMLTEAESANLAANYIPELLPVHALTGLAYFYDNLDKNEISSLLQCDVVRVNTRTRYARKYIERYCNDYAKENKLEIKEVDVHLLLLAYVNLSKRYSIEDAGGMYYAIMEAVK